MDDTAHTGENRPEDTNAYETPAWLYKVLDLEFGFEIDAFASDENHKCGHYFTQERSAFEHAWNHASFGCTGNYRGATVWCNPPYSSNVLGKAVHRMAEESQRCDATVVALIPNSTGATWFHECVLRAAAEVRFFLGRIAFEYRGQPIITREKGKLKEGSNRGDSILVVWRPHYLGPPNFTTMRAK